MLLYLWLTKGTLSRHAQILTDPDTPGVILDGVVNGLRLYHDESDAPSIDQLCCDIVMVSCPHCLPLTSDEKLVPRQASTYSKNSFAQHHPDWWFQESFALFLFALLLLGSLVAGFDVLWPS